MSKKIDDSIKNAVLFLSIVFLPIFMLALVVLIIINTN